MSEAKNESALSDLLGLLVVAELDAYYDGEYMDHSVVRERLRDFGRAVQAAERERWAKLHASAAEVLDEWRRTFPEAWSLRDQQVLTELRKA